jgi:hypothetical protein
MKLIVDGMPWEETGWTLHLPGGAEIDWSDLPLVGHTGSFEIRADGEKIGEVTLWPNSQSDPSLS